MSIMVRMRETIDSFDVVGLPLRTSNREAARTIPPHWRAAADAGLLKPEKPGAGPGIYAVYTDYETPGDDVDGVYTTDPRIVSEARRLDRITFEEMLEMASLGSKVLQTRSVEFAGKYKVKTRVLSSLTSPDIPLDEEMKSGTLITFEEEMDGTNMEQAVISGIAFQRDEAKITLTKVPDVPGIASRILGPVAAANIDVDMIVQNQAVNGTTDFSFTVNQNDFKRTMKVLETEVVPGLGGGEVNGDPLIAKVSIVGLGMKSHAGIAARMFECLAKEGINIRMISTSEIKTSVVIEDKYLELAVRALHAAFGLEGEAVEEKVV